MKNKGEIMNRCYYKSPSVISRTVVDEVILAGVKVNIGDLEDIHTLTGVGIRIWELIDGKRNLEAIKKIIIKEYAVKAEEAEKDLVSLIRGLEKIDCVRLKK